MNHFTYSYRYLAYLDQFAGICLKSLILACIETFLYYNILQLSSKYMNISYISKNFYDFETFILPFQALNVACGLESHALYRFTKEISPLHPFVHLHVPTCTRNTPQFFVVDSDGLSSKQNYTREP